MNWKTLSIIFTLLSFIACNEEQPKETNITEKATNEDLFIPSIDQTGSDYHGVYHFGESEMETSLLIYCSPEGGYFAQLKSGEFNDDATEWIWNYENLKNVKIEGNKFFSDKSNGEFVTEEASGQLGLRMFNSWSYEGEEIGYKSASVDDYYVGDYTEASLATITVDELKEWRLEELRLMRNEIYARYGFKFNKGGAMDTYFKITGWFSPQHKNVDALLTPIEKQNVATIKKAESLVLDPLTPVKENAMKGVLVGSWICNSSKAFELKEDGSFYAEEFNNNQSGTWWLTKKVLHIFTNSDTVKFTIGHMDHTKMVIEKVDLKKWHNFLCQTGGDYRVYSVLTKDRPAMRNLKNALVGYWYSSEGFELKADGAYIHHGPDCADGKWKLKDKTIIIKESECGGMEMDFEFVTSDRLVLNENWTLFRKKKEDASIPTPKSEHQ
ncbi:MAG: YARHG domain-containing protein [Vicingaceae bacterium]|nr:YARHG domain-containing protein [Vicingaceae bacterium]